MSIEAMKQAREALEQDNPLGRSATITALRTAIEQAEKQEPVAWYTDDHLTDRSATTYSKDMVYRWQCKGWPVTPLYTTPPAAQWVGLTEKDFSAINQSCLTKLQAATSAESILKEKKHG